MDRRDAEHARNLYRPLQPVGAEHPLSYGEGGTGRVSGDREDLVLLPERAPYRLRPRAVRDPKQGRDPARHARPLRPDRRLGRAAPVSGLLTTHVLDTAGGKPAPGMAVELFVMEGEGRRLLKSVFTNA